MSVQRDVLDRLDLLGVRWYITGSEALALYAEPRTTRDLDLVVELTAGEYESRLRPAFEDAYLVADPVDVGRKVLGALLHRTELARVDLIMRRTDPWGVAAFGRRVEREHPTLGRVWVTTAEDLILAKLEWSEGASELQLRDCRSIVRLVEELDWTYLERYAAAIGVAELLRRIRAG